MTLPIPGGLYPILDADLLGRGDFPPEEVAKALARAGILQVQLRCKAEGGVQYQFFSHWLSFLRRFAPETRIFINDRADLALLLEAHGLHVGQEDLPVTAGRKLLGPERIIGLSTHTLREVAAAPATGADYIGFGPVFPTTTKANPHPDLGLSGLHQACRQSVLPVVAIGGIDLARLPQVLETGVAAVAMISGIFRGEWRENLARAAELCYPAHRHPGPSSA